MSEQDTTTPEVATTDTPEQGTGTEQQHNWEQRYQELQPAYTRAAQEAAELRQWQDQIRTDPDAQRALLAELGYDVADDTPDEALPQSDAEIARLRQEFEEIKQTHAQEQQSKAEKQMEEQWDNHFSTGFAALAKDRGYPVSKEEGEIIQGIALGLPPTENGLPSVTDAYTRLSQLMEEQQQRWAASKRTPYRVSPNGVAGTEQPDLDNESERVAWMNQRYADLSADA